MRRGLALGCGVLLVVPVMVAAVASGVVGGNLPAAATPVAVADIPADYLTWYVRWARECPGLSWSIVAAIGKLETDHGRSQLPGVTAGVNSHGAAGPMQFGIGGRAGNTWAAYGIDGDGDSFADVYNPADAIRAAVGYLCANGARDGANLHDAIFAYNHSQAYVRAVLAQAQRYAASTSQGPATAAGDVQALLASPRLRLTPHARSDLQQTLTRPGWIDPRVIGLLHRLIRDHTVSVSVLRTGHSTYVKGTTRVSHHTVGRAVDIHELDGQPISASHPAARAVVVALLHEPGPLRPDELGSPFAEFDPLPVAFTDADHQHHLHVGYAA